jgi:hypothetical protein
MKTKMTMIAAAARQRPTNLSSRAVKSRSAMGAPFEPFGTIIQQRCVAKITQCKNTCRPVTAARNAKVPAPSPI